ncbi:MAG: phosphoribosylglycinamide formyltransferase [Limnobacter sp.]|nr:phosphoribosylglycinamide formyltransferase [Limnobacter sp.]
MSKRVRSIVVLISGRGSNLAALVDYAQNSPDFVVAGVVSNRADAPGLAFASSQGIPTEVVDHALFGSREAFEHALAGVVDLFKSDAVVLAGFMRILTPSFVNRYAGRLINIHPSLLPAFPGLNTHERALEAGVRVHGATVHLVTAQLDHGPILDQAVVQVHENDTPEALARRVLELEHRMLPRAVSAFLHGKLKAKGERVPGALRLPLLTALSTTVAPE